MTSNPVRKKAGDFSSPALLTGVPGRARTAGVPLRRRTLYPTEVQRRVLKNGVFSRFFTLRPTSYLHYYNSAGFQNPAFLDFKNPLHSNYEPDLKKSFGP